MIIPKFQEEVSQSESLYKNKYPVCLLDKSEIYNLGISDLLKCNSNFMIDSCKSLNQFFHRHKTNHYKVLIIHLYPEDPEEKISRLISSCSTDAANCRIAFYFHEYTHELFQKISRFRLVAFFQIDDTPEEISRVIYSVHEGKMSVYSEQIIRSQNLVNEKF